MMHLDCHFPTPVWWTYLDIDNEYLLNFLYKLRASDPQGRNHSNNGGWQSQTFPANRIKNLAESVMLESNNCFKDYGYDPNSKLIFGNAWGNINKRGNTNQIHLHPGSFLSGVYYVKTNQNSGDISFYRDFNQQFILTSATKILNPTKLNGTIVRYPVNTGKLLLFPSTLLHAVEESDDDEDRVSVSFNMSLKR